jgi:hypothetical protein
MILLSNCSGVWMGVKEGAGAKDHEEYGESVSLEVD